MDKLNLARWFGFIGGLTIFANETANPQNVVHLKSDLKILLLFTEVGSKFLIHGEVVTLEQCFPTFFGWRHPYLVSNIFGGIPGWLIRYKDKLIITIGGTLVCRGTPVGNQCTSEATAA